MNNSKKLSIKGLQNIGHLIARTDLPTEAPKRERRDCTDILAKTSEKIHAALIGSTVKGSQLNLLGTYLHAAIREAHTLGHAEALEQNSAVEKLLEKQYEARTKVTMPAVVAAVMEQSGLASMTMDLALMATVFERTQITYTVDPDTNVIEYSLRPVGDGE